MIRPDQVIQNRKWIRREHPFPYVRGRQVFTECFYTGMASQFKALVEGGLSEALTPGRFSRSMPGYDAYGVGFDESLGGCLSLFVSPAWHDLVANLFGVKGTGYINPGGHHHKIGSAGGAVHNDFNPAWFPVQGNGAIRCP